MDRFKGRTLRLFYPILIIILFFLSFIEIIFLLNLRIREFLFIFFLFIGIVLIILNNEFAFFYILTYLLFMPFLRRVLLLYEKYSPIEILYLVPDILILFQFSYIFLSKIENFKKILSYNEFKVLFFLQILMFLEIFNPIQGPLIVGFGGAKFLLIPSLLAYIAFFNKDIYCKKIKNFIIYVGLISLFYAYLQVEKSYFSYEKKWLINVKAEYGSLFEFFNSKVRPFSFFSSVSEFGQFMAVSSLLSLFFLKNKIKFLLFPLFIFGIYISGVRSSFYMLFFSIIFYLIFKRIKNYRKLLNVFLLIFISYVILVSIINLPDIDTGTLQGRFLQGIFDPLRRGSSFLIRLNAWIGFLINAITVRPFGSGLGIITMASRRFYIPGPTVESTFFGMFVACGFLGGFLLFYLVISIIFKSIKSQKEIKEKISLPLILIISISIGQLLTQYLIGAIFWSSIGLWVKNFYGNKHDKYKDNHFEKEEYVLERSLKQNQRKF
ncbi:MAG: hypothetical protein ABIM78_03570 [candidate division WOR-3 bacterium]